MIQTAMAISFVWDIEMDILCFESFFKSKGLEVSINGLPESIRLISILG